MNLWVIQNLLIKFIIQLKKQEEMSKSDSEKKLNEEKQQL